MKKNAQDAWDSMHHADREKLLSGDTNLDEMLEILEHIVGDNCSATSPVITAAAHAAASQDDWDRLSDSERERALLGS